MTEWFLSLSVLIVLNKQTSPGYCDFVHISRIICILSWYHQHVI